MTKRKKRHGTIRPARPQSWKVLLERLAVIMCMLDPRSPDSMLRPVIGLVSMPEEFNIE